MRFTKVGIIATLSLAAIAADDSTTVKSSLAKNAIEKRYGLARRAEQEYRSKLAVADKQLVAALDQAVREAMSNNDLNEATSLTALKKQAAEHLAAEQSTSPGPAIAGTRWNWLDSGTTFMTFKPDGALTCNGWGTPGKWTAVDDSTVDVIQPDKAYERVTFTTDLRHSLWVEVSPGHGTRPGVAGS